MAKQIYVNLPVKDIVRTNAFFSQLGYTFNPNFSDDKATCMIITEDIFVMLLQEEFFKGFTNKEIRTHRKLRQLSCHSLQKAGPLWMNWCVKQ